MYRLHITGRGPTTYRNLPHLFRCSVIKLVHTFSLGDLQFLSSLLLFYRRGDVERACQKPSYFFGAQEQLPALSTSKGMSMLAWGFATFTDDLRKLAMAPAARKSSSLPAGKITVSSWSARLSDMSHCRLQGGFLKRTNAAIPGITSEIARTYPRGDDISIPQVP